MVLSIEAQSCQGVAEGKKRDRHGQAYKVGRAIAPQTTQPWVTSRSEGPRPQGNTPIRPVTGPKAPKEKETEKVCPLGYQESRLAYRFQEQVFGGVPLATKSLLAEIGEQFSKIKTSHHQSNTQQGAFRKRTAVWPRLSARVHRQPADGPSASVGLRPHQTVPDNRKNPWDKVP